MGKFEASAQLSSSYRIVKDDSSRAAGKASGTLVLPLGQRWRIPVGQADDLIGRIGESILPNPEP